MSTGDKQTDRRETDLVLEVTPTEVGHLKISFMFKFDPDPKLGP